MRGDEAMEERKQVLYEFQKAEDEFASLKVKAARMGEQIVKFGAWMRDSPQQNIYLEGHSAHRGFDVQPVPKEILEMMTAWGECFNVADKLREASKRLEELRRQKTALGLR